MEVVIYVLITLICLFSTLNLTDFFSFNTVFLIYASIISLIVIFFVIEKKDIKFNMVALILMYFYVITCTISCLVNGDIKSFADFIMLFLLYVASLVVLPKFKLNINKILIAGVLISHIPVILLPLISNGIDTVPYQGIISNANSFGLICTAIFAVLLAYVLGKVEKYFIRNTIGISKLKFLIFVSATLGTLYLITLSASRTSLLSATVCILVGAIHLIFSCIKYKKFVRTITRGSMLVSILSIFIFFLLKFTSIFDNLEQTLFTKMSTRSQSGDLTAGRVDIWKQIIQDAGILGNGNDYYASHISIGAHNTFISIIGQLGWMPSIIFFVFVLTSLFLASKYVLQSKDEYKYLPLITVVNFTVTSMTEVMLFSLNMVIMFISLGSVYYKNNLQIETVKVKQKKTFRKKLVWRY